MIDLLLRRKNDDLKNIEVCLSLIVGFGNVNSKIILKKILINE